MKRQASATGLTAAVLMVLGGIILCAQLSTVRGLPAMDQRSALPIELGIYLLMLLLVSRRYTVQGYLVGMGSMLGLRLIVTVGAATWVTVRANAAPLAVADHVFSSLPAWMGAVAMSVLAMLPMLSLLPQRAPRNRRAELVAELEEQRERTSQAAAAGVEGAAQQEQTLYLPNPPAPTAAPTAPRHLDRRSMRAVEGWVDIPVQAILSQLPDSLLPSGEVNGGSACLPLSVVLPELPEGMVQVRLPDIIEYLPDGCLRPDLDVFGEDAPLVTLPLEVIVPQLPPEVLEVEAPSRPPAWLRVDPELERTLFVKA